MYDADDPHAPPLRAPYPWEDGPTIELPAEHFEPWERWAWSRIAVGDTADMSKFPELGGPLWDGLSDEQKAGGQPVVDCWRGHDAGVAPQTETDVREDRKRLSERAGGFNDEEPHCPGAAKWPVWQTLSARFLRTVLFAPRWASARTRPFVRILHARIEDDLDWENERFEGAIQIDLSRIDGAVNMRGLTVERLVSLQGSTFAGLVSADGLTVKGNLFLRSGARFEKEVSLLTAKVDGDFSAIGSSFEGPITADGLVVSGSLFLRGARFANDLRLVGARVDGQLSATNATIMKRLAAERLTVLGTVLFRDMHRFGTADLLGAHVGTHLDLSGSRIDGEIDLSGSHIDGELVLDSPPLGLAPPRWSDSARLILRNVTAGALQSSLDGWRRRGEDGNARKGWGARRFVHRDLGGLTFTRLGGTGAGAAGTLADAKPDDLVGWLEDGRAEPRRFEPAPYRTLARALDEAGYRARARAILRALGRHEARCANFWPPHRKLAFWLSGIVIGHGFGLWRAGWWYLLLVAVFAAIGVGWEGGAAPAQSPLGLLALVGSFALLLTGAGFTDERGWRQPLGWLCLLGAIAAGVFGASVSGALDVFLSTNFGEWRAWGGYSLANATPIFNLVPGTDGFLAERFVTEETGAWPAWLRFTFGAERVLGLAILSFLVAGLTGWAKRYGT